MFSQGGLGLTFVGPPKQGSTEPTPFCIWALFEHNETTGKPGEAGTVPLSTHFFWLKHSSGGEHSPSYTSVPLQEVLQVVHVLLSARYRHRRGRGRDRFLRSTLITRRWDGRVGGNTRFAQRSSKSSTSSSSAPVTDTAGDGAGTAGAGIASLRAP
jgi:hypothetical protein